MTAQVEAATPAGEARRPRRTIPAVVVLACLLQLALGLAWSTLQPSLRALDEPAHVAGVLQLVYHHSWPAPDDLHETTGLVVVQQQDRITGIKVPATPQPRNQRLGLEAAGGATPYPGAYSQMAQHPPLYYALVAVVVRLSPGAQHWHYDRLVALMRWISALLLMPLPLLAWAALRRFSTDRFLALGATFAPLLLPGIARAGGSVSNDSLQILVGAGLALLLARVVTGDRSTRTGVLVGVVSLLDLLTKGTGLVAPIWVAVAYAWVWLRSRHADPVPPPLRRALIAAAAGNALGLVWWIRNVIAYGSVQPAGAGIAPLTGPPGHDTGYFIRTFFSALSFRFWGALGLAEPPQLDRTLCQVATYVVLALLLVGLVTARRQRVSMVVLLLGVIGPLLIITAGSYGAYHRHSAFAGVQGRYLYIGLICLAVPAIAGLGTILRGRLRPLVPVAVLVLAGLLEEAGAREAIATTFTPAGAGITRGIHVLVAWAPYPAAVTYAPYVAALAVGLLLGVLLLRDVVPAVLGRPTP